jgi:hypothetical protein
VVKKISIFFILYLGLSAFSQASLIYYGRSPAACMDQALDFSSLVPPSAPTEVQNEIFDLKKLNELVPPDLSGTENGSVVLNRIADNGFQKFVSSAQFKSTQLGTFNEKVKEQTKVEVSLKPDGKGIEHKLNAQLQPFQGGATVSYRGYVGVDLSFQPLTETQKIKVEETILNRKLYYENSFIKTERRDQIGVRWDW